MERFGLTLPLKNQYFLFRVGQNFAEKGGKTVTNAESCLLDWPITDLGRDQVIEGAQNFLDMRGLLWPAWKRMNNLAMLSGNQGGKEGLRKLVASAFAMWAKLAAQSKEGGGGGMVRQGAKEKEGGLPTEIDVYCSDFKAGKQVARIVTEHWGKDESVTHVNLRFTEFLRERSLGASVEHGGFDGCGRDELGQIWALDNLDGSHKLGGVESCEQVLSRCMKIIREIEATTRSKQVVLISHCDTLHILQTIFSGQKPGSHRLLSLMTPGFVKEVKFSSGPGGMGDDLDDGEVQEAEQARSIRVYLTSSVGLERHRDTLIRSAFPRIADMCARRNVSFTYVDLRMHIEDPVGLGDATIANRLKTLESSNTFICLMDTDKEQYDGPDEKVIGTMSRDDVALSLFQLLDQGPGGAMLQFQDMHTIVHQLVQDLAKRTSEAERLRLLIEHPELIRREVDKARALASETAVAQLTGSMGGIQGILDMHKYMKDWFEEQKQAGLEDTPEQVEEMAKLFCEMTKDYEDAVLKEMIKGVMGLAMNKVKRKTTLDDFRSLVQYLEKKCHAIGKANEKYPWVGRWSDSSLTEIEVRYASLSSVPAIELESSFYYTFEDPGRRKTGTARVRSPVETINSQDGSESKEKAEESAVSDNNKADGASKSNKIEAHHSLLEALGAEGIGTTSYSSPSHVAEMIVEEFEFLLDAKFPVDQVPGALEDERNFYFDVAKERSELYVPEAELVNVLNAHCNGDVRLLESLGVYMNSSSMCQSMVVVGEPGSGKSALMAHTGLTHKAATRDDIVIMHFAGSCFDAMDPIRMMHRFVLEMLGSEPESRLGVKLKDADNAATQFLRAMEIMHFLHQGRKNVVILIDGIDLLSQAETNIDLWLPHIFPSTVRIVVSCCNGPMFDSLAKRNCPSVRVPTLRPEARSAICASYLARIGRVFSMEQMSTAVSAPFTCSPLFLTGLAQQCRLCYSRLLDESPSADPVIKELDRSRDVRELYANMFAELDVQYDGSEERGYNGLVRNVLTLIWASRRGLQEFELFQALQMLCPAPYERLLELLLELKQRVVLTHGKLRLFHRSFVLAVERRYLGKYFEDDLTDLMVDGHLLVANYFASMPDTHIRKIEEYPYQLCHCVSSYPDLSDQMETYLLKTEVFREMADLRFHSDLCGYWKVICSEPGSAVEIVGKYMGSFQDFVIETGDKGVVPELCFSLGFLLEDLGQYRAAKRVFEEALRCIENLLLMHPFVLSSFGSNLQATLFEMKPKILLHLGSSLIKAGLLSQAQSVLRQCQELVDSLAHHAWARSDTQFQIGILAMELGYFALAERSFKLGLQYSEASDLVMQDNLMHYLMDLYRDSGMVKLQAGDYKSSLKMFQKEEKTLLNSRKMWTKYIYLDPASSRPPSAILSVVESAKLEQLATFTSFRCNLMYDPMQANQPTNLTVAFMVNRTIEEGDELQLPLKQLRAGSDRDKLEATGRSAEKFKFSWMELTRTLIFKCIRACTPSEKVEFTIPFTENIRLPVKQAGDDRVLEIDAKVHVIKARRHFERVLGDHLSSRPGTRAGTGAGSRPGTTQGGLAGFLLPQQDGDDDDNEKGSRDVARLDSRLGEVLGLKTLVLQIKHNEMLGYRDEWLKERHASQLYGIEWHMRYAYDDNMKAQLLERMDKMQVNEVDGAHIAYENVLRGERLAVMEQAEKCIHQAIKMQEYLFGSSHPMVTDSMMTMVRMYIARMNLPPALSLLKLVWASRTGPNTAERLKLGHPRERECSLYHMGITQWLSGNMKAACVILEELLKVDERSVRDLNNVESLLSLCHISGCTAEERIMLAGQCIPWLKIVRPLNLSGVRLSASDALGRDPALVPKTTMRAWSAVGQCLKVNTLVKVLDLSKSAMGPEGAELVKDGICLSKSLVSLNLSGNMIGNTGAVFIRDILRMSKTLTELDMSNNGLEDAGMRVLSSGIAQGSVCYNSTLRGLNIAQNGISPDGALTISLALKVKTVRVSNLDISTNPIYDAGIMHIFDAVFMGAPFVSISLRDCQFGLQGVIKISEAMRASDTLKFLDLSNRYKDDVGNYSLGNRIDGMGAQVLADAIGDTHSLTCLDVSGNQVSKTGAAALCQCLMPAFHNVEVPNPEKGFLGVIQEWDDREVQRQRGSKGTLRTLKLRGCQLGSEGAVAISKELERNPALIGLDLCQSGIGGTGVASIAVALGSNSLYLAQPNTNLTYLNIQCCEAFSGGATHVASMLKSTIYLRKLVFSDNDIGAEGATALADALAENGSLSEFILPKNNIGDRGAEAIGKSLAKNKYLTHLDISLNAFGDYGATGMAKGIGLNSNLSFVDLSQNRFSAEGAWYLSLAGKTRPIQSVLKGGGALKLAGLDPEDQVREMLPRILTIDRCHELLSMRNCGPFESV